MEKEAAERDQILRACAAQSPELLPKPSPSQRSNQSQKQRINGIVNAAFADIDKERAKRGQR